MELSWPGPTLEVSLRLLTIALSCSLACAPLSEGAAYASIPSCPAPFARLLDGQVFRGYAVPVTPGRLRPVRPHLSSARARHYRTRIGEEAEEGPDFADRYTIIRIGCGAATLCIAIADAVTGQIWFPPELRTVEGLIVDTGRVEVDTLNFRRDSRLLIVVGSPNEQTRRAGISHYTWRSGRLTLIRFTPAAELCGLPASTRF